MIKGMVINISIQNTKAVGMFGQCAKRFLKVVMKKPRTVFQCELLFWSTSWRSLQQRQLVHLLHLRSGFDTSPHTDTFIYVWANSSFGTLRHTRGRARGEGQKPNSLIWNSCSSVSIRATRSIQFVKWIISLGSVAITTDFFFFLKPWNYQIHQEGDVNAFPVLIICHACFQ